MLLLQASSQRLHKIGIRAKRLVQVSTQKTLYIKMELFRKSISFHEIEEREPFVQENPLRDMFAYASN